MQPLEEVARRTRAARPQVLDRVVALEVEPAVELVHAAVELAALLRRRARAPAGAVMRTSSPTRAPRQRLTAAARALHDRGPPPSAAAGGSCPPAWFYVDRGQQRGPVATEELASWIQTARLPRDVQVWREGLPQWTAAETLPELTSQLQASGFFVMGPQGPLGPVDVAGHPANGRAPATSGARRSSGARACRTGSRPAPCPRSRLIFPRPPSPRPCRAGSRRAGDASPTGGSGAPPGPVPAVRAARPRPIATAPARCAETRRRWAGRRGCSTTTGSAARCSNGLVNRRQFAWLLDIMALWGSCSSCCSWPRSSWASCAEGATPDLSGLIAVLPWLLYFLWLFRDGFSGQLVREVGPGAAGGRRRHRAGRGLRRLLQAQPADAHPVRAPGGRVPRCRAGPRLGDGWANTRVVWKKHQGAGRSDATGGPARPGSVQAARVLEDAAVLHHEGDALEQAEVGRGSPGTATMSA
jgi:hypothetical protein